MLDLCVSRTLSITTLLVAGSVQTSQPQGVVHCIFSAKMEDANANLLTLTC